MGLRNMIILGLLATVLLCAEAPAGEMWEADAGKSGLSATDIALLKTNRILIGNEAYKQIFSGYLDGKKPLFITSDSLLNAYHVLYEESVYRLENAMARRLPDILRLVLKNMQDADRQLKGNPALAWAAKQRAMLTVGIALRLIDDSFQFDDATLNTILAQEVKKITAAEAVDMPEWLGQPDESFAAVDYSRYTPRGFYVRSERLQRYYRAVSWLQSIPFRIHNDVELLAMLMLGNSVTYQRFDSSSEERDLHAFFGTYSSFIGAGDDWDLMTAAHEAQNELRMDLAGDDLQKKRAWLEKEAEGHGRGPKINDQIRFAPDDPKKTAEPQFRIVSAYRTPCAILFQRTTDLRRFERSFPTGLEVAASLGSVFARERLGESEKEDLLQMIDSCRPYFDGKSLYLQYLNALKTLLDTPESDAPDFMKTKAWAAKSCNTALSGWAQLRHTWALQAKQTVHYKGFTMVPSGFVEPEPEFFSRMADLADTTRELLKQVVAFTPDYDGTIQALETARRMLDGEKDENELRLRLFKLSRDDNDMMRLQLSLMFLEISKPHAKRGAEDCFKEQRQWLDTVEANLKKGAIDKHPNLKEALKHFDFDLDDLWDRFGKVSRRLEAISHKQLRHADLSESENAFIQAYGKAIAGIMLYGGNSYLTPRDDAPRIVDVYANLQAGGYLHVGVARPRKLYVLYPWKGETVLCEGAIMPYYELVTAPRLTDESWKERLDSTSRPPMPKWLSPVVAGGGLNRPALKQKD